MSIFNSFVRFVLFVVKKRGVVGKTIKNFVVKFSGVELCGLCDLRVLIRGSRLWG
jgi:hypothetical protein